MSCSVKCDYCKYFGSRVRMSFKKICFIFGITLPLYVVGALGDDYCKLDKDCKCVGNDGYGINMKNVEKQIFVSSRSSKTYFLSLCDDSKVIPDYNETNTCSEGYSICCEHPETKENKTVQVFELLSKNSNWTGSRDGDSIVLKTKDNVQLQIICAKFNSTLFTVQDYNSTKNEFFLFSKYGCIEELVPHPPDVSGLGTGAVITVLILVSFFCYCVLGMAVNAFFMGARGIEIIPNIDFWKDLPSLMKDGAVFIQNGCRVVPSEMSSGRETYDSI